MENDISQLCLNLFAGEETLQEQRHLLHSSEKWWDHLVSVNSESCSNRVHQTCVAEDEWAIHGDIKASNVVLMETVSSRRIPVLS